MILGLALLACEAHTAETNAPAVAASASNSVRRLTLDEAYTAALTQSESLTIDAAEWEGAEARYRQAIGAGGPEVRAEGSAEWRDSGSDSGNDTVTRAGIGASFSIFNGFRTRRLAEARRVERSAFAYDLARDRQLLYEDVADVFYQALSDARAASAVEAQIEALNQQRAELERRVTLGRSRRAELLSAETQIADARVTLAQVRGARAASLELLAFLTGLPAATLEPVDRTVLPEADAVERFLASAEVRPDLQAQAARAEAARRDASAARADRNLSVDADGNLYLVSDPGSAGDWDLTLKASLPLFDRGSRRAVVAERVAQARVSHLQLAQLRRSADRDVRAAYADVVSALAQWAAIKDAVRVSESAVQTQTRDFGIGRASNLDVLASVVQHHTLRRREAVLDMQAKAALVRLHVAAGSPAP